MTDIHFGTDGWRAVIADTFTFDNVRLVASAVAVAARSFEAPESIDRGSLVVGYDRRFLSREFALVAAETLRAAGFHVLLSNAPTPSQTISFTASRRKVLGGIVLTASHNPAKYNGIKVKGWYGGSALTEMYDAVSNAVGKSERREGGSIVEEDFLTDYISALRERLDVRKILDARLAILHDPIYGTSAQLPSRALGLDYVGNARILRRSAEPIAQTVVDTIRGEVNPGFGNVNPEPIFENLAASNNVMLTGEYDLAICNDGDADRLGILDDRGEFVSPQKIISLLALYFVREKEMGGEIVKTFTTTRLIERIAKSLKATLHETAVGFKYVADLMRSRNILIGGEESGGIAFGNFLPERDGVLAGLLVAECVAHHRKPLSEIVTKMEEEFGALHYDRRDVHRPVEQCARLIERARSGGLDLAFGAVIAKEEKDGVKLNLSDGTWILFRRSGTEPMIRIYCESPDKERVQDMLQHAVEELDRS
jgi:phosphomannomutase